MIAGILAWIKMAKDKGLYDKSRDALGAFWRVVTLDYTIDENMNSQRIKNIDEHVAAALAWLTSAVHHKTQVSVREQLFDIGRRYDSGATVQVGDKVFVLISSDVPFVLRSSDSGKACFFVVGDC
jgi:hypothetical protein